MVAWKQITGNKRTNSLRYFRNQPERSIYEFFWVPREKLYQFVRIKPKQLRCFGELRKREGLYVRPHGHFEQGLYQTGPTKQTPPKLDAVDGRGQGRGFRRVSLWGPVGRLRLVEPGQKVQLQLHRESGGSRKPGHRLCDVLPELAKRPDARTAIKAQAVRQQRGEPNFRFPRMGVEDLRRIRKQQQFGILEKLRQLCHPEGIRHHFNLKLLWCG